MLKKRRSFTLLEIMIVIGLIVVLAILLYLLLDPKRQIEKAWDSRRKQDLAMIKDLFENHYNDKMYFPLPTNVCFDVVANQDENCYCHICATKKANTELLSANLCDPQTPNKEYLYQFSCEQADQPQWYRVCAILSNTSDTHASASAGTAYNYGVSSTNITAENCTLINFGPTGVPPTLAQTPTPTIFMTPTPTIQQCQNAGIPKYCKRGVQCNICGYTTNECLTFTCDSYYPLYIDTSCLLLCTY